LAPEQSRAEDREGEAPDARDRWMLSYVLFLLVSSAVAVALIALLALLVSSAGNG
jgi:hypothetical protein